MYVNVFMCELPDGPYLPPLTPRPHTLSPLYIHRCGCLIIGATPDHHHLRDGVVWWCAVAAPDGVAEDVKVKQACQGSCVEVIQCFLVLEGIFFFFFFLCVCT